MLKFHQCKRKCWTLKYLGLTLKQDIHWTLWTYLARVCLHCNCRFLREIIILQKVLIIHFCLNKNLVYPNISDCTKRDNPEVYRPLLSYCQCPRCWPKSHSLRFLGKPITQQKNSTNTLQHSHQAHQCRPCSYYGTGSCRLSWTNNLEKSL